MVDKNILGIVVLCVIYILGSTFILYKYFEYGCIVKLLDNGIKSKDISLTKWIYNETKMNIVGSFICAILLYLIPIITIFQLVKFVYVLFHIGRKDK